jgi:hypothetical protein
MPRGVRSTRRARQSDEGRVLVILSQMPPEDRSVAYDPIYMEFVERSKLPL